MTPEKLKERIGETIANHMKATPAGFYGHGLLKDAIFEIIDDELAPAPSAPAVEQREWPALTPYSKLRTLMDGDFCLANIYQRPESAGGGIDVFLNGRTVVVSLREVMRCLEERTLAIAEACTVTPTQPEAEPKRPADSTHEVERSLYEEMQQRGAIIPSTIEAVAEAEDRLLREDLVSVCEAFARHIDRLGDLFGDPAVTRRKTDNLRDVLFRATGHRW